MREIVEVLTDYIDDEGNQHIDCYTTEDADENGFSAGYVTQDGQFVKGQYVTDEELKQDIIQESINQVINERLEAKQEVIDRVISEIKKDIQNGDVTAIDELLMFTPLKNLIAYLPEE